MRWLYMQSLGGFSGPRQYLDNQFTYGLYRIINLDARSFRIELTA